MRDLTRGETSRIHGYLNQVDNVGDPEASRDWCVLWQWARKHFERKSPFKVTVLNKVEHYSTKMPQTLISNWLWSTPKGHWVRAAPVVLPSAYGETASATVVVLHNKRCLLVSIWVGCCAKCLTSAAHVNAHFSARKLRHREFQWLAEAELAISPKQLIWPPAV